MASSPVKFFSVFLAVSVVGWVVFTFAARLLAWFLSRVLHASVAFRVAGFNCLRDVTIKFSKGSLESISIGEIKLSFRKSLVKLSFGVISKDPKVQLLINDLEIVTRSSSQSKKVSKSARPRSTGKGKWLVTSSMARLLSVSVTDLMIKGRVNGTTLNVLQEEAILWCSLDIAYSARSAYQSFFGRTIFPCHEVLWKARAPLKCWLFQWLALQHCCWTADCLQCRLLPNHATCPLCSQEPETAEHLFMQCSWSRQLWLLILCWAGHGNRIPSALSTMEDWWLTRCKQVSRDRRKDLDSMVVLTIWRERNSRVFQGESLDMQTVITGVKGEAERWRHAYHHQLREPPTRLG